MFFAAYFFQEADTFYQVFGSEQHYVPPKWLGGTAFGLPTASSEALRGTLPPPSMPLSVAPPRKPSSVYETHGCLGETDVAATLQERSIKAIERQKVKLLVQGALSIPPWRGVPGDHVVGTEESKVRFTTAQPNLLLL